MKLKDQAIPSRRQVTRTFCTTRQAAEILGVSLRTVQMWSNNGLIETWKTGGGHRRLSRDSVERLVHRKPPVENPAAADWSTADEVHSGTRPLRVLVVEDDPDLLRLYRANLARWTPPPQVIAAGNGYEALVLLGREAPDLLVLDLHLPEIDGFRILRALREMPALSRLRVVVVTGLEADVIAARGGIAPDIEILPKPVPFERLQAIAETVAARRN